MAVCDLVYLALDDLYLLNDVNIDDIKSDIEKRAKLSRLVCKAIKYFDLTKLIKKN